MPGQVGSACYVTLTRTLTLQITLMPTFIGSLTLTSLQGTCTDLAPEMLSTYPANAAQSISNSTNITLVFSKPVKAHWGGFITFTPTKAPTSNLNDTFEHSLLLTVSPSLVQGTPVLVNMSDPAQVSTP